MRRCNFQRDCNAHKGTGKQSYGKGKQSKSWSKSEPSYSGKGTSKENKGKSKGTKSANQGAKGVHKGKTSNAGLSGLENSKSDASSDIQESALTCTTDVSWKDGWNGDEWNYGWIEHEMEDSIGRPVVNGFLMKGAWQFQGYDENGLLRSLNGRLTGVHKVLCSAAEVACKGRQDFYLRHDGGYMIPIYSKLGQEMRNHFEK